MIQENEVAARFADAFHFFHDRDWVRNAWTALKPFPTGGNYVNFQTTDEGDERTEESYRSNYARLQQVKAKYDPTNLFRVNRNIRS